MPQWTCGECRTENAFAFTACIVCDAVRPERIHAPPSAPVHKAPFPQPIQRQAANLEVASNPGRETDSARALRRDLELANRAIADLWLKTGGLADFDEGTLSKAVADLLMQEVAVRLELTGELREELMHLLKQGQAALLSRSRASTELDGCYDTAVAATVARMDSIKELTLRAEEAETRAEQLQRRLAQQEALSKILSDELRDVRCAKALQEIVASSDNQRLRHETEAIRRDLVVALSPHRNRS